MIILFLKLGSFLLRKFTSYSATALPGLILEKYFPGTLKKLFNQLDYVIVITGTNGKTTTARILQDLLKKNNIPYIHNKSGSNMIRGLTSTLVDHADWVGNLAIRLAVLETEEATLPKLAKLVHPKIIVVTNIFRDQLDAYGEIDKTLAYIHDGIASSGNPLLILNADDQRVASLKDLNPNNSVLVGFKENVKMNFRFENRSIFLAKSDYLISKLKTNSDQSPIFDLVGPDHTFKGVHVPLAGRFNAYNAAVALLAFEEVARIQKIPKPDTDLSDLSSAFGRGEKVIVNGTSWQILLVKNPAGMNLNLDLVANSKNPEALLLMLNDNTADGKDVSWIWDTDLSLVANLKAKIYLTGTRCWDLALRLKYEGLNNIEVFEDVNVAVKVVLGHKYSHVYALPTYTAMLELRKELGKYTKLTRIHE